MEKCICIKEYIAYWDKAYPYKVDNYYYYDTKMDGSFFSITVYQENVHVPPSFTGKQLETAKEMFNESFIDIRDLREDLINQILEK